MPHYWPTESGAALESLVTLTINDDPALSYARHLDIAADLPRLAPNLRVFHWHYGKQYNQGGGGGVGGGWSRRIRTANAAYFHSCSARRAESPTLTLHCMRRTSTSASTSPSCSRDSRTSAWPAVSSGASTSSTQSSLSRSCSGSTCGAPSWRRRTSKGTSRTISSPCSPHQQWETFNWPRELTLFLSRVGCSDNC